MEAAGLLEQNPGSRQKEEGREDTVMGPRQKHNGSKMGQQGDSKQLALEKE